MTTDFLIHQAAAWNLSLSPQQAAQFERYLRLLLRWNQKMNLTAVTQPDEVRSRHFLDSLACAQLIPPPAAGTRLIDVGTGAGFPGLPLKILYPQLQLTLADSVAKKTRFLSAVVAELQLSQVSVVAARAEALGQDVAHREQYDWAVARSVAYLPVLAEYLLPLVRIGGQMLAQKGANAPEESVAGRFALQRLGGGEIETHSYQLPGHDQTHYLLHIPKVSSTPARYPRRPGIPNKRPLNS